MQTMKTLVIASDADGCIYNKKYDYLIYYLIASYGDFFLKFGADPIAAQTNPNVQNYLKQIIADFHTIGIEYDEKHELVLNNLLPLDELQKTILNKLELYKHSELNKLPKTQDSLLTIKKIFARYIFNLANKDLLKELLSAANTPFIMEILNKFSTGNYNKIVIISASNRTSMSLDKFNMKRNGTGLFAMDLQILCHIINAVHGKDICSFDDFYMADIFSNLNPGTSHWHMMKDYQNVIASYPCEFKHGISVFDESKLTVLYAISHHIAKQYGSSDIMYMDDHPGIQNKLMNAFYNNKNLLSTNINLEFWLYQGPKPQLTFQIKGLGDTDLNFYENVKKMVTMCGHGLGRVDVAKLLNLELFKKERVFYNAKIMLNLFKKIDTLYQKSLTEVNETDPVNLSERSYLRFD